MLKEKIDIEKKVFFPHFEKVMENTGIILII